jgi:MOSC domain-containing protein YiiM
MNIKLQSIARRKIDGDVREELFSGEVTVTEGLRGDYRSSIVAGVVSVLSKESWVKVCHEIGTELPWFSHGSNLLIKGFEFLPTDLGKTICIGEAQFEITGELNPDLDLKSREPELYEALLQGWRGGVVCKVLRNGNIQSGDDVDITG